MKNKNQVHTSVLLHEVIDLLAIQADHTVVDATLGSSGHAKEIISRLSAEGIFIGLDADREAIAHARETLKDAACRVILEHANFREIQKVLAEKGIKTAHAVLFDLGWRAEQLSGRGMSFQKDEPLLMALDAESEGPTARDIVNTWDEQSIANVIYEFGEEHFSRHIASAIVQRRAEKPIERTHDLRDIIYHAVPVWYRKRRIHPATKTFQALRIVVNDELNALKEGLAGARDLLATDGRIAVITFHSLEDRIVKHTFKSWEADGKGEVRTAKPVTASKKEIASNPRARSAKLRVFQK